MEDAHAYDVAIVGGGLVGASLAIALDGAGLRVALVEAAPAHALPAVFDERSLTLAEASVNALRALDVLQRLPLPGAAPIARIEVTRAGAFGRACLEASRYGRQAFGQVVRARDFGEALEARLVQVQGLVRLRGMQCTGTDSDGSLRRVHLQGESGCTTLQARLLVAADGTRSAIRAALGIASEEREYGHHLHVARVRLSRLPDGTAYERLTDAGPTALLPRSDRAFGLVHGVPDGESEAVATLPADAFAARVQDAIGWRLGRVLAVGERSVYAARRVVAEAVHAPRAVLVGNAAQTLHPLGAQGFNLGLRDALTLAELLRADGADVGSDAMLRHYAARRAEDRAATLRFSDGFLRAGMQRGALAVAAQSAGLLALGHPGSLQASLVGGAMGYRGDVPALCRA